MITATLLFDLHTTMVVNAISLDNVGCKKYQLKASNHKKSQYSMIASVQLNKTQKVLTLSSSLSFLNETAHVTLLNIYNKKTFLRTMKMMPQEVCHIPIDLMNY